MPPPKTGARLVANCEVEFPNLLRALDPPPMRTMLGNPEHARPEAVAIVGARNASAAGRKIARASRLSAAQCSAVLMELELAGDAITLSGGPAAPAV